MSPAPKVCTNQSTLTFPPAVGAKYEQAYPYKSKTWQAHFTHGRQAVESVNRSVKHGMFQTIKDPDKRPRRGWIAQFLAVTLMVAATNVRKIVAWFKDRADQTGPTPVSPRRRARRRDLTDGYRSAPKNDPPDTLAS